MTKAYCRDLNQSDFLPTISHGGFLDRVQRGLVALADTLLSWQERAAQRTHLASLDDHLLRDMGLSRADVEHEISLPFWRVR